MDALTFFGIQRTDDRWRWRMPVVPELCSGMGTLFGGCGLGAAIEVLERATDRPLVWATAQYLSFARPPSVLHLDATEVVRGHQISQARVVGHVDGEEIFTVNAALGRRQIDFAPGARRGAGDRTTSASPASTKSSALNRSVASFSPNERRDARVENVHEVETPSLRWSLSP